ncbi:MAG: ECF-type sigma factor [Woeseiaceae bacterium]
MSGSVGEITKLLRAASAGDRAASDELFTSVFQELRALARLHRRRWNGNETLNTTALINEVYLRLANQTLASFQDRVHFFATASRAIRQILINYAERATADKRGGNALRVTLTGLSQHEDSTLDDLLHINALLGRLEDTNPRHCRLFEYRVFGGMTIDEAAIALDVSAATVKRDWTVVSAWLFSEMNATKSEQESGRTS